MTEERYSVLALDQSMTSTGFAHLARGDKRPSGGLLSLPPWGDDEGKHLFDFDKWLTGLLWDFQVTHLYYENRHLPGLTYKDTMTKALERYGLMTLIEVAAETSRRAGQSVECRYVDNAQWTEMFWGTSQSPKGLVKHQARAWRKAQSIRQCDLRGWDCRVDGRESDDVADAMGILNFGVGCVDPRWASISGPLFRRAQLNRENEERELR